MALALLTACASGQQACGPVPLDADLAQRLDAAAAGLGFAPLLPCSTVTGQRVLGVRLDSPGGASRLTLTVGDSRTRFTFSQAGALPAFHEIPEGTRRIAWTVAEIPVRGFEGASLAGVPILYVQWSDRGVTYEFQAMPVGPFPPAAARETARALVSLSAGSR